MHEQAKIDEARYFYSQMCGLVNNRAKFNFNLSAFLSAARSVLQYALKEAQTKTGGQAWYDGQVASNPVVKFLKDKRDISIHATPVRPSARIEATVSDTIHISDSVSVKIERKDGTTEETQILPTPPPPKQGETSVEYQFFFQDWTGSDDVVTLCKRYLKEVETIVADGVSNGFLTS
jgi:hypothetical protein